MKASIAIVLLSLSTAACTGPTIQEQISAASEGRALERMADNLSNKANTGTCSIIRTGGFWTTSTSTTVSCP